MSNKYSEEEDSNNSNSNNFIVEEISKKSLDHLSHSLALHEHKHFSSVAALGYLINAVN